MIPWLDEPPVERRVWRFKRQCYALDFAQRRARRKGVRYRATLAASGWWLVYPTPAPAPSSVEVEPCS